MTFQSVSSEGLSPVGTAPGGIAIIGMAAHLPGAADVAAFWRNLCEGVESIARFGPDEIEDAFAPDVRGSADYVPVRSILPDADKFDAGCFGMQAREAELTDPQHRVFLEICWEALEDAGCDPARFEGAIGVFAGSSMPTYFLNNICADRAVIERFTSAYQVTEYPMLLGASQDFLATRVAYKLNLRGPAMTLQTACSTSLTAVAQACKSLLLFESDMALAGGVSITFPQRRGYLYQEGGMASADGHCRPFDAQAGGTVFGSGAAVVLLRRLEDAIAEGDHIYAVIRGHAMNNDGAGKVGFTAPSVDGQVAVVAAAQAVADVQPQDIGYIECHGTATPLGDPIEVAALQQVFSAATDEKQFCALGSAKGNVGHLDCAAGATGLIKAALAVQHGVIPPTVHYRAPNPRIDFANSAFFVNGAPIAWPDRGRRRLAGVSALGVGGTNVHVILEEPPLVPRAADPRPAQLLVLSARSEAALAAARARLAAHLAAHPDLPLADVAWTLQTGRREFAHRCAVVAADVRQSAERLAAPRVASAVAKTPPAVAFMFPGQGAQYPGMGGDLYAHEPCFRREVDTCAAILQPVIGEDIRDLLYSDPPADGTEHRLLATIMAQPAIFVTEYALARMWMTQGIHPASMIGHSIGEFVAATLAGVMSLDDALDVVAARGRLMQTLPRGGMLAVRLPEAKLLPLLGEALDLAAVNGPNLCVAAGPLDAIAALEEELGRRDVMARRLHTSHAFHSRMMDPAVAELATKLAAVTLRPPELPYVSTVTGQWITPAEATSPEYWARHCRATVRFADALATLAAAGSPALVEVGPGKALTTLALQALPADPARVVVSSLPDASREAGEHACLGEALGRLWMAGITPEWAMHHAPAMPRRLALPTYPFERRRHWIEAPKPQAAVAARAEPTGYEETPGTAGGANPSAAMEIIMTSQIPTSACADTRPARARAELVAIFEKLSGEDLAGADDDASFLELGFDSLLLGQAAQQVQASFGTKITFRQLLGEFQSLGALAAHLAGTLPADAPPAAVAVPAAMPVTPVVPAVVAAAAAAAPVSGAIEAVMQAQLETMGRLMADQLAVLRGGAVVAAPAAAVVPAAPAAQVVPAPVAAPSAVAAGEEAPSRFSAYRPGAQAAGGGDLTPAQRRHLDDLIARYTVKTAGSKRLTQQYRAVLADPRAAAGFRAEWKEMVYPIVSGRSKGSKIHDVDGNEYIDLVNGYGQTFFGHAPDFVVEAVARQLHEGFAIGPQSDITGEVAALFCEMTGNERATFCNTGSEAVMAALRLARCVTGRTRVVAFAGAYHGQFDEVLVKGARQGTPPRALPIAPGIPADSVQNMVVLPYGDPESLDWVRAHANELAAVLVETVQSRHPALQPRDFIAELRSITGQSGTALVFDEVVTGFRMHPGGMQAVFGIRADLATYGKVVGGGMPVGVLAGARRFMDALDGGMWQYGDDSIPEVAPTFFAGTFVRHPLVLAALKAVLLHLKQEGPALQQRISACTADLAATLNGEFAARGLRTRAESFGSLFYFAFGHEDRLGSLLYYHLRLRGIHVQEGFPCFLTTAHSDADIARIVEAFRDSLDEMLAAGALTAKDAPAVPAPAALPDAAPPSDAPLTEPQKEVWLVAQLGDAASCSFNESVSVRFDGALDEAALTAALRDVVGRHDALRARFGTTGERMLMTPGMTLDMPVSDQPGALDELIADEARTPFDLADGPLVRARLVRLGADRHVLLFTAHHIVCDGWSVNVIVDELAACYAARRSGTVAQLPAALPFSVYSQQQTATVDSKVEAYWLSRFATLPPLLELPTDRIRPAMKSYRGATYSDVIDAGLYAAVKKAGARQGCTLFVTLLAGFQLLLGRLAGQSDIVVGIPSAGQSLVEDKVLVGHCVNFLPLRTSWEADTALPALLQAVRRTVLDAYEHQSYTLGTLVRKLAMPRVPGRIPLVEVQFNLERLSGNAAFPGLQVAITPNPKRFVNFDMFLNIIESDQGLRIDVDYSTDLFDEATIVRWMGAWRTLLEALAAQSDLPVSRLPILPAAERQALLAAAGESKAAYPAATSVDALVAARAAANPEAVAVVCGEERLTYGALDAKAGRLANQLRQSGTAPEARVGIVMDRSADMLVALLAVMKAGCAYVPLDPDNPPARLRRILEQAGVAAVLADAACPQGAVPPGVVVLHPGRDAALAVVPSLPALPAVDRPAYVIFTSGSTGQPKGVEVMQHSVVNLLCAMARTPGFTADDTLLAVTTIAFDIAALELFLPLISGGRVVIARRADLADGFALLALLRDEQVSVVQATPSLWRVLLEAGVRSRPGLRMLCGGEPLTRQLADLLLEGGGALWNVYGPTETTIWSSADRVMPGDDQITIGRPIANTRFYILDKQDQPVPVGVAGELNIAGDGLARGYVGQPDLTRAAFREVALADAPDRLMYRTGDLARRLADGRFQVLGRLDSQIKLRGFRIELGEIEAALSRLPGISAAAVGLQRDSDDVGRLVGYYVAAPGAAVTTADLRRSLAEMVPPYMIPAAWMQLDRLPMTPNGKLDRGALPRVEADAAAFPREIVAPRSPLESKLVAIFAEVLKGDAISVHDNLFALGADSIQIFQIAARMVRAGIELSARHLMLHPTVAELAAAFEATRDTVAAPSSLPSLRQFRRVPGAGAVAQRGAAGSV